MRYRIYRRGGHYFPQFSRYFFWSYFYKKGLFSNQIICCRDEETAMRFLVKQEAGVEDLVTWEGESEPENP
jgi:hypothetical protein